MSLKPLRILSRRVEIYKRRHGVIESTEVCPECGGPKWWTAKDGTRISCPCTWTTETVWSTTDLPEKKR